MTFGVFAVPAGLRCGNGPPTHTLRAAASVIVRHPPGERRSPVSDNGLTLHHAELIMAVPASALETSYCAQRYQRSFIDEALIMTA